MVDVFIIIVVAFFFFFNTLILFSHIIPLLKPNSRPGNHMQGTPPSFDKSANFLVVRTERVLCFAIVYQVSILKQGSKLLKYSHIAEEWLLK